MTRNSTLAMLAAGTAMIALLSAPAVAEGTSAGTTITNTATIDYRVGGVDQTEVVASDTFDVDRKVNFIVIQVTDAPTTVSPGQTGAVIAFEITNLSNDTIDLALEVIQKQVDNFDTDNLVVYLDNGNGVFDAGDTVAVFIDELLEDQTVGVFVVSDIPISATNGEIAEVLMLATPHAGQTPGTEGAILTSTPGPDTDGVETVLADGAGDEDGLNDGVFSAQDSYTVSAASLTVTKASRVLSDPVNAGTNPKAIPGATIEYCVAVRNGSGTATATNIVVTDVIPADLTFDGTYGIRVDGTVDGGGACVDDGVAGGSFAAGTVTAPLSDVAANQTRTVYFRATIN